MKIGAVIRKYRKEKGMTQEELASSLGVTAPAVNKWEHDRSYPEITLLAPLSQLLGVTLEALLCFEPELSEEQEKELLNQLVGKMKTEPFDETFSWGMQQVRLYPNSVFLLYHVAQFLEAGRSMQNQEEERYWPEIKRLYDRVIQSGHPEFSQGSRIAFVCHAMQAQNYTEAEKQLEHIPRQNVDTEALWANLYLQQGAVEQAYQAYEKIAYQSYQKLSQALNGLYLLEMKAEDWPRVEKIIGLQELLAEKLEMSRYMQITPRLEYVIVRQDKEGCLQVLSELIQSVDSMMAFTDSDLYRHMEFSKSEESPLTWMMPFFDDMLATDESLDFVREEVRFQELMETLRAKVVKK